MLGCISEFMGLEYYQAQDSCYHILYSLVHVVRLYFRKGLPLE